MAVRLVNKGICNMVLTKQIKRQKLGPWDIPVPTSIGNKPTLSEFNTLPINNQDILIYRKQGGIGDILMLTPAIEAIAKKYPGSRIHLGLTLKYANGALGDVIKYNPYVYRVVHWQDSGNINYAAVVDITHAAYGEEESNPYVPVSRIDMFAEACGVNPTNKHTLYIVDDNEDKFVVDWLLQNNISEDDKIIVINPASTKDRKDWPIDKYKNLVKILLCKYSNLHFVVMHNDKKYEWDTSNNIHNFCGQPFRLASALIRRAHLVITPDTGTLHVAAALDVPTFSVFGPTNPNAICMYYPLAKWVWDTTICEHMPCWYNRRRLTCPNNEKTPCINNVTVDQVLSLLVPMINDTTVRELAPLLSQRTLPYNNVSVTSSNKTVSIIIPTLNNQQMLNNCINSIRSNTKDILYNIIVVNNASSKLEHIDNMNIDNITIINNPKNLGFGQSCNIGANCSDTDYLLFLNDDTLVEPYWLNCLIQTIEHDIRYVAVAPKLLNMDNTIQYGGSNYDHNDIRFRHRYSSKPRFYPLACKVHETFAIPATCMLVKRKEFDDIGGFDPVWGLGYFEDDDLCIRFHNEKYVCVYCGQSEVFHVGSQTTKKLGKHNMIKENHNTLKSKWGNNLGLLYDNFVEKELVPRCYLLLGNE